MAFFDFLGDTFKGIGNFGADADKFMKREMPFDSGWGAPAALVATYFGGPAVLEAMGGAGEASAGGYGIGQGANYSNFANTSGNSFGNLNPAQSLTGGEYGLNFGSPSSIASSNSAMGLSDLSPSSNSSGSDLLKQLMLSQQKTAQQNKGIFDNYSPTQVTRQSAFFSTSGMVQVQDKQTDLAALIKALRG
jgi:hypothetical protein